MFSRTRTALSMLCLEDRTVPAAGDLDLTFGSGGKVTIPFDLGDNQDQAESVRIQPDGKIVIAGFATFDTMTYDFAVTRLNTDGSLDTTFDGDGKTTITVRQGGLTDDESIGLAIQADGKIVLVGNSSTTVGNEDFAIIRLNTDGSLDTTFNGNGRRNVGFDIGGDLEDSSRNLAIDSAGRILVIGYATVDTNTFDFAVTRINTDGSLDTTFDGDGRATYAFDIGALGIDKGFAIAVQPNGQIVLGGLAQNASGDFDFAFARLNPDGSLDTSFDGDGRQTVAFDLGVNPNDRGRSLILQPDGKIVMSGIAAVTRGNGDIGIARLNPNGSLDSTFDGDGRKVISFDVGGNLNDRGRQIVLQPDGKLVVVAAVQVASGNNDFGIARLNSDGSFDTSFNGTGRAVI